MITNSFPLQRSIHQGCPLAPYLHVLTTCELGYMLHYTYQMKLISRVSMPQNIVVIKFNHSNKSVLFLQNYGKGISNTIAVL